MTRLLMACWCVLLAAAPAAAQGRYEIGGGVHWTGALPFGDADADESTGPGGTTALFSTASELGGAPGLDARLGFAVLRSLYVEALFSLRMPSLTTQISSDVEGIPDVEAVEDITELAIEGAVVVPLANWRIGARTVPFVTGGGGYLRQLHEGRTFVQTGQTAFAGGGLEVKLGRGTAGGTGLALRVDGRIVVQRDGVALDQGTHAAPRLGASVSYRF